MNPLLEQFLSEAYEFLQGIGEKLMQLEQAPNDSGLMNELFRLVHTLKGNSGLFDFPEMTRVLHAGEDLMDGVRNGRVAYSQSLADQLLDAMDFIGHLCDEIKSGERIGASHVVGSTRLAEALRALIPTAPNKAVVDAAQVTAENASTESATTPKYPTSLHPIELPLADIPEAVRVAAYQRVQDGESLHWITYIPSEECFYQGDDPFYTARQTSDYLWGRIMPRASWSPLAELDAYRCVLDFQLLSAAPFEELTELYRYVPDQVQITAIAPLQLVIPQGDPNGGPVYEDFVAAALHQLETGQLTSLRHAAQTMLELSNHALWFSSAMRWLLILLDSVPDNHTALRLLIISLRNLTPPNWILVSDSPLTPQALSEEDAAVLDTIFTAQRQILMLDDHPTWQTGRLKAVVTVLINCCIAVGDTSAQSEIEAALEQALASGNSISLLDWLNVREGKSATLAVNLPLSVLAPQAAAFTSPAAFTSEGSSGSSSLAVADKDARFGRRAEDAAAGSKSLKVDQAKIDRLMNLIGEMVVSKNALPYLAQRAEDQFGVRELSREIKAQYAVINRIAEEMQDAIIQVRMLPVSFVFQRFPRLVRDISRKLGKEVQLLLEGEETEADKNIIESLADPLIHIVRNSLDHGLETTEIRRANGKPAVGKLTIRASQEGDRVIIEIIDDGKGIDPLIVKRKAYEKGLIDETTLERISDRDAINLVFSAGFSTADVVSDLSGRGVGMDVVRSAVEKVNGAILLESDVGKGTRIRISLPLSMAVTKVMIVESDQQLFGVPMDHVIETVRVPCHAIRTIKRSKTTVLRGNIVPLKALNALLALPTPPKVNAYDEMAVLVARVGGDVVGLLVDDFHETVDVIQKPLSGVLAGLSAYSGSALMGDGSVLMVLNIKEMV